ncbi:uncharacterized protein LOC134854405 [Symsagittifera roscoffensis]|uniref:uncharacterized protein LOC134854405 n=1 Tax=Symsagittifera roscoffensis TaxID=84072 RepID=UPI00307CBA26
MCLKCVKADFPIAERVVLSVRDISEETRSNFAQCVRCGSKQECTVANYKDYTTSTSPNQNHQSHNQTTHHSNNHGHTVANNAGTRQQYQHHQAHTVSSNSNGHSQCKIRHVNFQHVCVQCGHVVAEHSCSASRSEIQSQKQTQTSHATPVQSTHNKSSRASNGQSLNHLKSEREREVEVEVEVDMTCMLCGTFEDTYTTTAASPRTSSGTTEREPTSHNQSQNHKRDDHDRRDRGDRDGKKNQGGGEVRPELMTR